MRILSVGSDRRGLSLLELMVAMALAGMIMAISFPSVVGGLDGVKLQSSGRRVAAFINAARERVEREQFPVEVVIETKRLRALSADGAWEKNLDLVDGVEIPAPEVGDKAVRRLVLLPGVPVPRLRVPLRTTRGRALTVELNPLTGVPEIEEPK